MSLHSELPRPTVAELAILRVLWERGPSTVRQVQEALSEVKPTGYTTPLKLLQIMTEKGLVQRDASQRTHIYTGAQTEQQAQKQLAGDLIDRAFGGSAAKLVLRALDSRRASADEIAEIRRLLDEMEGK